MGTLWPNYNPLALFVLIVGPFCIGIIDRSAQHHHDLLRDRGTSHPLRTFESAGPAIEEGDCNIGEDREGPGDRRYRWRRGQIPAWNVREVTCAFYA